MSSITMKIDLSYLIDSQDYLVNAFSEAAKVIRNNRENSLQLSFEPISRKDDIPEIKFQILKNQWKNDIMFLSSVPKMAIHPAYQKIIGMGKDAVKLILEEMEQNPDHWFWALTAITDANPVSPEHQGNIQKMTEDWLKWGEENGYLK